MKVNVVRKSRPQANISQFAKELTWGDTMKKKLTCGILMALWLAAMPASAGDIDSITWLRGDYIGVGSVDMSKLAQRRIYTYLMDFFVTHNGARQAFGEIRAAGINLEEILDRVVVGLPTDVERAEHIVLWETSQDLTKYRPLLSAHSQVIDKRIYQGMEYFATRRENECFAIIDNVFVLGSELRVREVMDAHRAGYKDGPKNPALKAEMKRVDRTRDVWFVFSLGDKEKKKLAKTDPIIDMRASGGSVLKLSEIQKGNLSIDFSQGLKAEANVEMPSADSAKLSTSVIVSALAEAKKDPDVQSLGFDTFLNGLSFTSEDDDIRLNVIYSQAKFDELILLVTQFAKSVSGQETSQKDKNPSQKKRNASD